MFTLVPIFLLKRETCALKGSMLYGRKVLFFASFVRPITGASAAVADIKIHAAGAGRALISHQGIIWAKTIIVCFRYYG